MAEQSITLQPNESKLVTFDAIPHVAKTYHVAVDGLVGTFSALAPIPPPVIDLREIAILGIGGKPFVSVGIDTDGLPYGELAEPIVVSRLRGVIVKWQNKSLIYEPLYGGDIGIIFHMWHEPTWAAEYPCNAPPGFRRLMSLDGVLVGDISSIDVMLVFSHGYWCPGDYDVRIRWDKIAGDGAWYGGSEFRVKNALRCTGSGSTI